MVDWRKLVNHRVLIKESPGFWSSEIVEAVVIEVSPSGKYVKLRIGGSTVWVPADRYEVVEDLGVPPLPMWREVLRGVVEE